MNVAVFSSSSLRLYSLMCCIASWTALGHWHILSCCLQKRASLQYILMQPQGLKDHSCKLVMVPASSSCTCGRWVGCGPWVVSWPQPAATGRGRGHVEVTYHLSALLQCWSDLFEFKSEFSLSLCLCLPVCLSLCLCLSHFASTQIPTIPTVGSKDTVWNYPRMPNRNHLSEEKISSSFSLVGGGGGGGGGGGDWFGWGRKWWRRWWWGGGGWGGGGGREEGVICFSRRLTCPSLPF